MCNLLERLYHHKHYHIDVLMQNKRNCIAYALELRILCINPSIYSFLFCSAASSVDDTMPPGVGLPPVGKFKAQFT